MKVTLAREIAYDSFIQVLNHKKKPEEAVEQRIKSSLAPVRSVDRSFIKEVLYGSLRWYSKIFWIVQKTSDRDLTKVSQEIQAALVLGTYQIFYMSKVPDRAAVNESVEYIKKKGQTSAASFVNGILRSIARRSEYFTKPDKEKAPVEYLSLQYAHPKWLVERWCSRFSFDRVKEMLSSNNYPPPFSIRINACKVDLGQIQDFRTSLLRDEKIHSERKPLRSALILDKAPNLSEDSLFGQGYYTVQDEASQLIACLVHPKEGERVVDACCGPGGKISHIYELAKGHITLCGIEKNPVKMERTKKTFQRLGHASPEWVEKDFLEFLPEIPPDKILLDAPCSGLGVLRRHPDGKWHKASHIVSDMAKIQRKLLLHGLEILKVGGELIYSVCSYEPEETVDHLRWLLDKYSDTIDIVPATTRVPDYYKRFVTREGVLLVFSGNKDQMDGFGGFILRKSRGEIISDGEKT
jgi:16S rRNA (cytosine967-C5)-methyltransferase